MSVIKITTEGDAVLEESDEDDSDVILSDADYDDSSDDDLFTENVDEGLADIVNSDDDLNDSDEKIRSLEESDDEQGIHYPVFNPFVDFKGKIKNRCACELKKYRFVPCTCEVTRKCKFRIYGAKVKGEETFQLKSLNLEHACGRQHQNNKVTSEYLAERFLDEWRNSPSWKLSEFMKREKRVTGVELGYYKSVVKVVGIENPPPLFQRIYIFLQPCKEGFLARCRPILGVDGCHLRSPYSGICLTTIRKDGNNNIFPITWSMEEVENADTWGWFLDMLVRDLDSVKDAST
ncbi:uncharacterized protein LOC110699830 [Chenopodium quinoa]|uniref:uncharacterized protein LOC110699830 n=1 Tax=Chenopodium quinoa TaxID=63459 RepID=UPI000B76FABD|nr:uncharacterized protein LOC110699830 [Chenopodium quinoa]